MTSSPGPAASNLALIRLMTVDDHPIYRGGLAALIAAYPDLQLVAEAANGREAVDRFREHRPDVTLMDLSMPMMTGVEAIVAITSEFPDARIIALTTWDGDADIHRALESGARDTFSRMWSARRSRAPSARCMRAAASYRRALPGDWPTSPRELS